MDFEKELGLRQKYLFEIDQRLSVKEEEYFKLSLPNDLVIFQKDDLLYILYRGLRYLNILIKPYPERFKEIGKQQKKIYLGYVRRITKREKYTCFMKQVRRFSYLLSLFTALDEFSGRELMKTKKMNLSRIKTLMYFLDYLIKEFLIVNEAL